MLFEDVATSDERECVVKSRGKYGVALGRQHATQCIAWGQSLSCAQVGCRHVAAREHEGVRLCRRHLVGGRDPATDASTTAEARTDWGASALGSTGPGALAGVPFTAWAPVPNPAARANEASRITVSMPPAKAGPSRTPGFRGM